MIKCILTSLLALSCVTASAGVINFDGHDNTIYGDEDPSNGVASLTLDGYVFSNIADHFHLLGDPLNTASNGTSSFYSDRMGTLTMTRDGGGVFGLTSVLGYSSYLADTMTITGYFAAGGSISASFAINTISLSLLEVSGFAGLNRVTFSANPEEPNEPWGFGLDNVTIVDDSAVPVTVPVPEPLTASLFGIALASLGLTRRYSKRATLRKATRLTA